MAIIEGFFHGKSSGLDAYVILKNQPVLVEDKVPQLIDLSLDDLPLSIYLLDSGVSRSSKGLIEKVLTTNKDESAKAQMKTITDSLIDSLINRKYDHIQEDLNHLSSIQYHHMDYLIVDTIKTIWNKSLQHNNISIKLCGAGGGGFYLAFGDADDIEKIGLKKVRVK